MPADKPSGLEVDLAHLGKLHFANLKELQAWWLAESQAWQWLLGPNTQNSNAAKNHLKQGWTPIENLIEAARTKGDDLLGNHGPQIKKSLVQLFLQRGQPLLTSPSGEFLTALRERIGPEVAASALTELLPALHLDRNDPSSIRGAIEAAFFEAKIGSDTAEATAKALDELEASHRTRFAAFKGQQTKLVNATEELQQRTTSLIDETQTKFDGEFSTHQEKLAGELDTTREALANFKKAYDEQLALRAPVAYWAKKQAEHQRRAEYWGARFAWSLLVSAVAFGGVLWRFHEDMSLELTGLLFLIATPVLWALRTVSRNLVSQQHLVADAEERSVMVETYLAMLGEGSMEKDDRAFVLQSIFRPSQTGMVKEDLGPPTPMNLAKRILGGDR